jgi:uncharacterized membrane protein
MFLHIIGAIAAFGFGFYAPIFGMASAQEPQHGNWYLRAAKRLSNAIIVPFAILMFITGAMLVQSGSAEWSDRWLSIGMLLYFIALGIVFLLQRPTLNKLIAATSQPPGPEGPPAEVPGLVKRLQVYGVILLILTISIVALMVWKPTF